MSRTLEDISKEYNQQALVAGQAQYQVHVLKQDLARMNARMQELNQEAAALPAPTSEVADATVAE